jgi:carbon-monoxide dehydrogenase medium subunit
MYLPRFEYIEPKSIPEICSLLYRYGDEAKLLAGGTDLFVRMKEKEIKPKYLIDLKAIPGLDSIKYQEATGITLGALTILDDIEKSPLIQARAKILSLAAATVGVIQTRNKATLGGNLCNASPAADMAPALLAMDAQVRLIGLEGERTIPLDGFFVGPGQTVLHPGEILAEVIIPENTLSQTGVYLKFSTRKALDLAIVNLGVVLQASTERDSIQDIRVAIGAVAPTPLRLKAVEEMLKGKAPDDQWLDQAAQKAWEAIQPITDLRASADYRREMAKVFLKRGIKMAWEEAKKQ